MAAVTSLKLPPELKERVTAVLEGTDKSPHAFMVEAIEQQTRLAEQRKAFLADGLAALQSTRKAGKAYRLEDVRAYMQARMAGKKAVKPKARSWPR